MGALPRALLTAQRALDGRLAGAVEVERMCEALAELPAETTHPGLERPALDYLELAERHRGGRNRHRRR